MTDNASTRSGAPAGIRQVRLNWPEKLGYGSGVFGFNLYWTTMALFLAAFYTDVFGISAAAAGTMLLTTRIVDAFTDSVMGAIADRNVGINILRRAVEEPLRMIVKNAGGDPSVVLNAVAAGKGNYGYNAATGEYGDMIEAPRMRGLFCGAPGRARLLSQASGLQGARARRHTVANGRLTRCKSAAGPGRGSQ